MGELRELEAFLSKLAHQHASPSLASVAQLQARSVGHLQQRLQWLQTDTVMVHGTVLPCG